MIVKIAQNDERPRVCRGTKRCPCLRNATRWDAPNHRLADKTASHKHLGTEASCWLTAMASASSPSLVAGQLIGQPLWPASDSTPRDLCRPLASDWARIVIFLVRTSTAEQLGARPLLHPSGQDWMRPLACAVRTMVWLVYMANMGRGQRGTCWSGQNKCRIVSATSAASRFGNPCTGQIEWTCAKSGGYHFRTRTRKLTHDQRMEFRASSELKLGCAAGAAAHPPPQKLLGDGLVAGICTVGLAMAAGAVICRILSVPSVFDKRNGYFRDGRKSPDVVFDMTRIRNPTKLEDIHAIQLISESLSGEHGYSHEMNLVLRDGSRINVADHTSRDVIAPPRAPGRADQGPRFACRVGDSRATSEKTHSNPPS